MKEVTVFIKISSEFNSSLRSIARQSGYSFNDLIKVLLLKGAESIENEINNGQSFEGVIQSRLFD